MKLRFILLSLILGLSLLTPGAAHSAFSKVHSVNVDKKDQTVYVTRTGKKYHREGCRCLRQSKIPMKLSEARKSFDPCSVCQPPK